MAPQRTILAVEGMSCSHCSGTVLRTLEEIEGLTNVSVDLDAKKASFDATHSDLIETAIKAINEAGYKASNR